MNSDLEKEKNFETGDPSLQNTVMEVRRLKEKLEQMLLDQELPPGSGASNIEAAIDDLTAAHSETNVKLGRLDELKKKEHSIEETEKKLGETLEAITKHEEELNSVKQSMGEDAERLEEQRKIIQEAEEGIEYHKNTYNKLLEDEKEQEENEFQASSIDDSFVDEEDVHYPKERVEEAEEDYARLVDTSDENEIRAGLEAAAEQEATEAEEAALAEGATQEEQHDAYKTVINDFHSRYSFGEDHTYVKNDLEDEEEGIYAAQELKEKAEDDITKTQVNLSKLGAQHGEISSSLNQAQKDYESARKIAANMKLERDQLKNDIVTNLGPLVEKINKL